MVLLQHTNQETPEKGDPAEGHSHTRSPRGSYLSDICHLASVVTITRGIHHCHLIGRSPATRKKPSLVQLAYHDSVQAKAWHGGTCREAKAGGSQVQALSENFKKCWRCCSVQRAWVQYQEKGGRQRVNILGKMKDTSFSLKNSPPPKKKKSFFLQSSE